jgi:hypothetical protein
LNGKIEGSLSISCYDLLGRRAQLYINSIDKYSPEITEIVLTITSSQYNTAGIYFLEIWDDKGHIGSIKLVSK